MDKEIIDLIDTVVKIGLGTIISGAFAYLGIRHSHKSQKEKFFLEHKIQLLEKAIDNARSYLAAWDTYISRIQGIAKFYNNKDPSCISNKHKQLIDKADKTLMDSWVNADAALSYLILLGANDVAKALKKCRNLEHSQRTSIVFGEKLPSYDEAKEKRPEYAAAQKKVFEELSLFYSTLQS